MSVVWVPRSQWGASVTTEAFIANRYSATPAEKTVIVVHHTTTVDGDDSTPNRWDYDEAEAYMRSLQWARPDLGPLPYSENLAVSEDLQTVWLFEGRGILKVGAHTAGHNRDGVGWGVFGNFDQADTDAARAAVDAIEWRVAQLDRLPNLGSVKNPSGWNAWGHRDTSPKTCPGHSLYPLLATFQLGDEMTITQIRLELAVGWHSRTGQWMKSASGESAQERLTRLANSVFDGKRTIEEILTFAGLPKPQRNEPLPAWVLDPMVPAGSSSSAGLTEADVKALINDSTISAP